MLVESTDLEKQAEHLLVQGWNLLANRATLQTSHWNPKRQIFFAVSFEHLVEKNIHWICYLANIAY